jgi:hypothetical protein
LASMTIQAVAGFNVDTGPWWPTDRRDRHR